MSKEGVTFHIGNVDPRYRVFIESRNGQIALDIAGYIGIPFLGEYADEQRGRVVVVPGKTITKLEAEDFGISCDTQIYGAAIDNFDQVGKGILHRTFSLDFPKFHSNKFAREIADVVLPGETTFSLSDTADAFRRFDTRRFGARIKQTNESDGLGQYSIKSEEELNEVIAGFDETHIVEHGLVLEPDVIDPKTISIGYARIGEDIFSFIAHQKNDSVEEVDAHTGKLNSRSRYLGATVQVVRGDFNNLFTINNLSYEEKIAVQSSQVFLDAYQEYVFPIASRLSFDYLYGFDRTGQVIGGITDITARLGGTCPALLNAALAFKCNPFIGSVNSEVYLNYDPLNDLSNRRDKVYIDHPNLLLTAKVNSLS